MFLDLVVHAKIKVTRKICQQPKNKLAELLIFSPEEQTNVINKCEELQEMTRAKQQHLLAIGLANTF